MNKIDPEVTVHQPSGQEDNRLVQVVEEYRALLEAGQKPERRPFLDRYPDLAASLNDCFDGLEFVFMAGPEMREHVDHAQRGSPEPARPFSTAVPLGDYRVVREIGRGGMGVVYEAEQMLLGRRVALKVLPFAATMDARQLQRFQNEARAAACLHHPNIVPVYAVGCERGVHFYAMQFIEGQSLAAVISDLKLQIADLQKKGDKPSKQTQQTQTSNSNLQSTHCNLNSSTQLSTRGPAFFHSAARLGMQAAQALDHAHQLGVIHRDIKPANLMVDGRGNVWIADFGLAQIQGDVQLTMSGDLIGTLRYMSPEQALAKRVLIDHRTDVYSLGATLYELLTLEPVFDGGDRQELLRQIAFEEPMALRRHNKSIPAELETIVLKVLEKNPADRYPSAQELAEDLERFVKDEPIKARRPSLARRLKGWCRRHRALVTCLVAIVFTALLLVGIILWRQQVQSAATAQAADEELKEAESSLRMEDWPKATQALGRATVRLERSGLDPLQVRLEQLRREVALVARLEEAHLTALTPVFHDKRDYAAVDQAFSAAFAEYGLVVEAPAAEKTARYIQGSAIRTSLVAALDLWAYAKDSLSTGKGESLRAIARLADDDPWRQNLRDLWAAKNRDGLERLAQEQDILQQPPRNLLILTFLLSKAKAIPAGIKLLRKAQERYPADFWFNFYLAIWLKDSNGAEAVGFYRAALVRQPQNAVIYYQLAEQLHGLHKFAEAETACLKAITLVPDYSSAFIILGAIRRDQGKLPEAIAAFQKAIDVKPDNPWAYQNLGITLDSCGKYLEAEAANRKAIKCANESYNAYESYPEYAALLYINLSVSLYKQKKLPEAEAVARKAIKLNPADGEAYDLLGGALFEQRKLPEAEAAYRKAVELKSDDVGKVYINLEIALTKQQKYLEAIEVHRKAMDLKLLGTRVDLYNAACYAALAGCGKGDASSLKDDEYARLRGQSLTWLRAGLDALRLEVDKNPKKVREEMQLWQKDSDFDGLRGEEALAKLPEAERQEWRKLWQEVEELRKQATSSRAK